MSRFKLIRGYYLGTGLLTVVGTSFATLSTASAVRIFSDFFMLFYADLFLDFQCDVHEWNLYEHHGSRRECDARCMPRRVWICARYVYREVIHFYSKFIIFAGTSIICSFLEMGMAFIPVRILQRIFPPMVTGKPPLLVNAG